MYTSMEAKPYKKSLLVYLYTLNNKYFIIINKYIKLFHLLNKLLYT